MNKKFPTYMIHIEEKIKKHCSKISEENLGITVNDIKWRGLGKSERTRCRYWNNWVGFYD